MSSANPHDAPASRAVEITRRRAALVELALAEVAELIRAKVPTAAAITLRVWSDRIHLFAVHSGAAPAGGDIPACGSILAGDSTLLPLREITDLLCLARVCGLDPSGRGWRREHGRRAWWEADLDHFAVTPSGTCP